MRKTICRRQTADEQIRVISEPRAGLFIKILALVLTARRRELRLQNANSFLVKQPVDPVHAGAFTVPTQQRKQPPLIEMASRFGWLAPAIAQLCVRTTKRPGRAPATGHLG